MRLGRTRGFRRSVAFLAAALVSFAGAQIADAHYCNNIFSAPARLVVKPEKSTIYLASGTPAKLRVYLRNNFPYRTNVKMRGSASGYSISVSPSSSAGHTIQPGQNVSYLFTITRNSGSGNVSVANLNLQVKLRVTSGTSSDGWRGGTGCTGPNPPVTMVRPGSVYNTTAPGCWSSQPASLHAATLAARFPTTTNPAGLTGTNQLIKYFGYRFCYNASGAARCGGNCPAGTAYPSASVCSADGWNGNNQFPQNCMRAGAELGARKAELLKNAGALTAARAGATNALKPGNGGSLKGHPQHKCLAAVVGALLWQGDPATEFKAQLTNSANAVPSACQTAGLHILGASATCTGSQAYERAACAAAQGLRGNYGPVRSVLMANAGDSGYDRMFYAYMLYVVARHRQTTTGTIPFYPDAGGASADGGVRPDAFVPRPDVYVPPPPDKGTSPPRLDKGTAPPRLDTGRPPTDGGPNADLGPIADGNPSPQDGSPPSGELGPNNPGLSNSLSGGCAITQSGSADGCLLFTLIMFFALLFIRRSNRRR